MMTKDYISQLVAVAAADPKISDVRLAEQQATCLKIYIKLLIIVLPAPCGIALPGATTSSSSYRHHHHPPAHIGVLGVSHVT